MRAAFVVLALLSAVTANAQKVDKEKLEKGTMRASRAAKVLTEIAALPPGESIPGVILEKARVIAVFPEILKINLLVQKGMKGYGLAARRVEGGWSTPAFYGFGASDSGWTSVKSKSPDLIMLFVDDAGLKAFEKEHIAIAGGMKGPVGDPLSDADYQKIRGAGLLLYTFSDGKLTGVNIADDSSAMSSLGTDNNINKAVFGFKGVDVFWNKVSMNTTVPTEIVDFQNALSTFSKRP